MTSQLPRLSVVVLAYRSAAMIESFVASLCAELDRHEPDWEMILVGNFIEDSDDRTPEVVQRISEGHARIHAITRVKEGMMGWDMKSGLAMARGDVIAVIDGDGQNPIRDVIRVYRKLLDEDLDLAKTYRLRREDGRYRRFISSVYNFAFRILFPGLGCRDINSKPKIMTRATYDSMALRSNGWFIDAEIMIQARRMKLRIGEISTEFRSLEDRPSFVKPTAILEFMASLLWIRLLEYGYWFRARPESPAAQRVKALQPPR